MNKPIRILHVLTAMNRAGTETMLMNLFRNIDRSKIQFDFAVSSDEKCDYDDEIVSLQGKIYHYPKYIGYNHFTYKKWWDHFFSEHKEYKIVHGHIGSTAAIYLKIAKKYGLYAIAHSHSTAGKPNLHTFIYKIYSYKTRYIADYFFGCSQEALSARYGKTVAQDNSKSAIVKNGIDASKFKYNSAWRKKVRQQLEIAPNLLVLGTVGRLTYQKNPFGIIDIIKAFKSTGIKFCFLWIGTGELRNKIIETIYKEDLQDIIFMLGVRDDIEKVLQAMDIFIFPSFWEGLGIAGIEAQAAGLPTLCSNTIPNEICITDLCEFLPVEKTDAWIEAILKYKNITRKDTYQDVIVGGYDVKQTAKELEEFYLRVGEQYE